MAEYNVNKKKFEEYIAWSMLYSNSKGLARPSIPNPKAFKEIQAKIEQMQRDGLALPSKPR